MSSDSTALGDRMKGSSPSLPFLTPATSSPEPGKMEA